MGYLLTSQLNAINFLSTSVDWIVRSFYLIVVKATTIFCEHLAQRQHIPVVLFVKFRVVFDAKLRNKILYVEKLILSVFLETWPSGRGAGICLVVFLLSNLNPRISSSLNTCLLLRDRPSLSYYFFFFFFFREEGLLLRHQRLSFLGFHSRDFHLDSRCCPPSLRHLQFCTIA